MKIPFEDKEYLFGVHRAPMGDVNTIKETCLNAEKLEYDLFTLWDHYGSIDRSPMECWSILSVLADVSTKIQLGPLVSCVHFRHPTVLAKTATTVDIISNGRMIMGLGAGWMQEEFEGFFGRFPSVKERLDGLEDAAIICKGMFENEYTKYEGKVYSANNTYNSPRPVRGFIPIMIGGSGEKRTLKIAAKYANIIHLALPSYPQLLEHKVNVVKKHCKNVGRDFNELILSTFLHPILDESSEIVEEFVERLRLVSNFPESEAHKIVKMTVGPENIIQTLKLCHDVGIKLFTIFSGFNPELLETFKDEVISKL